MQVRAFGRYIPLNRLLSLDQSNKNLLSASHNKSRLLLFLSSAVMLKKPLRQTVSVDPGHTAIFKKQRI